MNEDLIANIYNSFHPYEPLQPGSPAYVDCSAVRGNENIFKSDIFFITGIEKSFVNYIQPGIGGEVRSLPMTKPWKLNPTNTKLGTTGGMR